ncbi:MAG: lysophospholipid acyltransferase family protein [Deltaproteobacteria bacterium]
MDSARHLHAIEGGAASAGRLKRAEFPQPLTLEDLRAGAASRAGALLDSVVRGIDELGPRALADLQTEVDSTLLQLSLSVNELGYDAWGFHKSEARIPMLAAAGLYRHWFRVRVQGLENLPQGRFVLAANHGGHLPFDAAMLATACLLEGTPPRLPRMMISAALSATAAVTSVARSIGGVPFTPANARRLLRRDEGLITFPEGLRGLSKPSSAQYRLGRFSPAFFRAALESDAPILPVAIVGSEEQIPAIFSLEKLARWLGLPSLPITPTFPLLGPLGLIPLPSRYTIQIGAPIRARGDAHDEADALRGPIESVRDEIQTMLDQILDARQTIF